MDLQSIVVLRRDIGPEPAAEYADTLAARFEDHKVRLARTPAEEREYVRDADIVAGVTIDEDLLAEAESLSLFVCSYAGTEHLPLEALSERGIVVTNAAGIHAPGLAAQAVGKILMFTRNLHTGLRRTRERRWEHFRAGDLDGKTVTVVGLGSIGTAITKRLVGFNVETIGVRHTPEKGGPTDEVVGFEDAAVNDALARTDFVVLASPLTETTCRLVGREEFITLPPEAVLINVARGELVDTDALVWALREGTIGGAALDVTDPEPLPEDHPLWTFEDVLVTPHIGGETPHNWERLADILERNLNRVAETGTYDDLENQVV
jgi:phosphoglycerate dehydrogenase-like enzyme